MVGGSPVLAFDTSVFATADSYVKSGQANKNQGNEAIVRIQDSGNNRALVRFDEAAIQAAVGSGNLTQARLRLNIVSNGNNWSSDGRAVAVHRMLQPWTELGTTWNCPDDANPANSSPDCTPWVMNNSSQYPFSVTPTDVIAHSNNQLGPVEWDVTADVQAFLAGTPNYGWLIKKTDESQAGRADYSSREGTVVPELVLTIDGPTPPAKPKLLDTFIRQGTPNKALGSELYSRIQDSGNNRVLVAFDQNELQQSVGNQTLVSAKLQLTIIDNADNWGSTGREVAVHRMLQGWTEVGATWNCADDVNTENSSPDCATNSWDMGHSANWPFDSSPTATALHTNGQTGVVEWGVTADVQAFLSGTTNYGWIVKKVDEGQAGQVEYSTREGASPPKLVLELSAPPPPEPLTLSIASPSDGASTPDSSITVSGSVQGPAGTTVSVNGQAVALTGGSFSLQVPLTVGSNIIKSVALAPDGRISTQTITIIRSVVLSLTVGSPTDQTTINEDRISITGAIEGPENAGVTVNGILATVVNGAFYVNDVPLQAGSNTITVVATTLDGQTTTKSLSVTSVGQSPFHVTLSPQSGIAPLVVNFAVTNQKSTPIESIAVDFDGDGIVDFSSADLGVPISFTYSTPGVYQAQITVTDTQGATSSRTMIVVAYDAQQRDALFEDLWNGMNNALARGDIGSTSSFLNAAAQAKYQRVFQTLLPSMAEIVASYSPLRRISVSQDIGEYTVVRNMNGVNRLYLIYFVRDSDGVWRLDAM